jgi:ribonuclease G
MEVPEHREQVYRALKKALAEDRARTNVLQISELGLVEMTRKRVRQDLRSLLTTRCPACAGAGVVRSEVTVAAEIFRALPTKVTEGRTREVVVRAHPDVAAYLEGDAREPLQRLARSLDVKIVVQPTAAGAGREHYEIQAR